MTTTPPNSNDVFEFERLVHRCMGNIEIATRVLEVFSHDFGQAMEKLEAYVPAADFESTRSTAHRLKGSSGNAAATQLQTLAAELEQAAEDANRAATQSSFRQLQAAWEDFQLAAHPPA